MTPLADLTNEELNELVATECWRLAPGHEGLLWVSTHGRFARQMLDGSRRALSVYWNDKGYGQVHLFADGGNRRVISAHRMVLETFIGPAPSPTHQAAHQDGNTRNNKLNNLRWATPKENAQQKWQHGTMLVGETANNSKLTEEQVRDIKNSQMGCRRLARAYRVAHSTIARIRSGKTWKHVS